jgi:hypothetical protein
VLLSKPLLRVLTKPLVLRFIRSAVDDVGEQPMLLLSPIELLDQQRLLARNIEGLLLNRALRLLLRASPGSNGYGGGVW